ncbi:MAG: 3-phosphoshikimate 1-carboxyvinyltransferase [Pirellulaceae bacterium]
MTARSNQRRAITPCGPLDATTRPPGSKSITNRALVCAALADGESTLLGALDSEDTRVMADCLRRLGVELATDLANQTMTVQGCGGKLSAEAADLFVANSGTTIRFLTAVCTLGRGRYRLDGVDRMHKRPIGDLLDALTQLGARATSENDDGCPPVIVEGHALPGGSAKIRGDISSQFLSGLLMAAPYAQQGVEIVVEGVLVSQPYVRMTLAVMEAFGVSASADDLSQLTVAPQSYRGRRYEIEPDASAASYFWGAAAIAGGRVTVEGLSRDALQGDVAFCDCLAEMGCDVEYQADSITVRNAGRLRGVDVDMNPISDTVQTLAAVALFAEGPTTIRGVAHIRHKETDRIGDLARELRKLGATVDEFEDGLQITPAALSGAEVDTYNDHRMAMSLALVGLKTPGVVINDPQCTEKTYPRFFDDLAAVCVG